MGSVINSLCGSFCIACLHPLTRRYNHGIKWSIYDSKGMESYLSKGT
ncbi:hypothetical protein RH728_004161 [Vibrio vulnificus]|nr:hypothetical protein [Vibrio vulnificus]